VPNLVRTSIDFIGSEADVAAVMDRLMNVLRPFDGSGDEDYLVGPIWCKDVDDGHHEGIHLCHKRGGNLTGQPLGEDDDGIWVLTLRGVAAWGPPLGWIIDVAGEAVDINVEGIEMSNLYYQYWERRGGKWRLVRCVEDVFVEGPLCDYPLVWDTETWYVRDGQVLGPLPAWVEHAFFCLGVDSAQAILGARWPEWEAGVLAKYEHHGHLPSKEAVFYAWKVLGGRWSEVEPMLLDGVKKAVKDDEFVIDYVADVIQRRWPDLETIILAGGSRPAIGVDYSHRIMKARWPELEAVLPTYPRDEHLYEALVTYAAEVVGGRWREAEEIILGEPFDIEGARAACRYARDVVKGRWEAGESVIAACTHSMLRYADEVLKGRLPDHLHNRMVLGDANEDVKAYVRKYGF
jgi:hypothetical protein